MPRLRHRRMAAAAGAGFALTIAVRLATSHGADAGTQPVACDPPGRGAALQAGKPVALTPYVETIPGTNVTIEMVPIPGGTFTMGSPPGEKGRGKDEGPTHEVTVAPLWMSKTEVPWAAYSVFLNIGIKRLLDGASDEDGPDAITYPTPPYADETFGYGGGSQPAIALTVHAVTAFTRWLSQQTGKSYRLPTEAEWEYACRAGSQTAYGFGDNPRALSQFAWFAGNSGRKPRPVGGKKPNAFGLLDMHGNVAEWVIDRYAADFYAQSQGDAGPVVNWPGNARYPHVVRGGGWKDKPPALRCAARRASEPSWSKQDPQNPQSIWWHTEATDVGFRIVRGAQDHPSLRNFRSKITEDSPN